MAIPIGAILAALASAGSAASSANSIIKSNHEVEQPPQSGYRAPYGGLTIMDLMRYFQGLKG